jgi:hypothetical protein
LALFAEMMKSKPWTPKTLSDLGGIAGVGVTFLEETFGHAHAPIQFRQHQEGVLVQREMDFCLIDVNRKWVTVTNLF